MFKSETPGALIGFTKHSKPIYLIGGGSQPEGEPPAPDPDPAPTQTPPTDPAPTPPVPTPPPTTPAPKPAAQQTEDLESLPAWAQKLVREARAEAGKARTTAKQTAAEEARQETLAQVAKALGLGQGDEPVDPDELTRQIQEAQNATWVAGVELQVHRIAGRLGADAEALLDSNAFRDMLDDLVDDNPRTAEFATALEAKVAAALEKHPKKYALPVATPPTPAEPPKPSAPKPDPSQGTRGEAPTRSAGLHAALKKAMASPR